jgi:1-phosphofructokinase
VLCNPYPAKTFPLRCYEMIAADVRAAGVRLVVDLSSPRLERVLASGPELVKLNDWELAEYVCGPVDGVRAIDAARRLQAAGARTVAVTRGDAPVLVAPEDGDPYEIVPPVLPSGFREGCGDAMTGAIAASLARGSGVPDALLLGTAAGSVNFLRHGLGSGRRSEIEELACANVVRPLTSVQPGTAG